MEQNKKSRLLLGQDNNALTWLIIINAVVFVIVSFIEILYKTTDKPDALFISQILQWITLPANAGDLLTRPWTILTHLFVQVRVLDLVSNLLWLAAFGYITQDLTGNQKLVPLYVYGGLAGALFFLLTTHFIPALHTTQPLFGPGPALMAIAVAATTFAPRYRLFTMLNGGIPLWVLTLVFVAVDYAGVASHKIPALLIAHLGGAAIGFIYVKQLQRGRDLGQWMTTSVNWLDSLFNPEKSKLKPSRETHFYKATRAPYQKTSHITQQRVDDLLDKINQHGYSRLTEEEKAFLKRASEEQN